MTHVVLSIGANLGDAATSVQQTIDQLSGILKESKASRIYQTSPVGVEDQPARFFSQFEALTDDKQRLQVITIFHGITMFDDLIIAPQGLK